MPKAPPPVHYRGRTIPKAPPPVFHPQQTTHIIATEHSMQGLSMMGTDGDMLPLLWLSAALALQHKVTSHLVVQPFQFKTVVDKLDSSPSFCFRSTETVSAAQKAYQVTFTPPLGCAPKVECAAAAEELVHVELSHTVFQTSDAVEFHVWAPWDNSWNEKPYQEWPCEEEVDSGDVPDLSKIAWKKPSYGSFLTKWQAVIAFLDTVVPTSGLIRVSNCYEQEGNQELFEPALGYKCDMHLRVGTLSLMDANPEKNKLYAISQALCPRKLYLSPKKVKEVSPKSMTFEGVITESKDTFATRALPSAVAAFLEEPTIVVTFSSGHFGTLLEKCLAQRHCLFISSNREAARGSSPLASRSFPESHLHWPEQLDLEAVFAKAILVVHSCGVGTAYQVVCSGTPSICVTLTKEQFNNAKRLEHLGVAVAFTLEDVMSDETVQDAFVKSLSTSFDEESISALQTRAKAEGNGLVACVKKMAQMFWPDRTPAMFWPDWSRVFWQMFWAYWSRAWRRWRRWLER